MERFVFVSFVNFSNSRALIRNISLQRINSYLEILEISIWNSFLN